MGNGSSGYVGAGTAFRLRSRRTSLRHPGLSMHQWRSGPWTVLLIAGDMDIQVLDLMPPQAGSARRTRFLTAALGRIGHERPRLAWGAGGAQPRPGGSTNEAIFKPKGQGPLVASPEMVPGPTNALRRRRVEGVRLGVDCGDPPIPQKPKNAERESSHGNREALPPEWAMPSERSATPVSAEHPSPNPGEGCSVLGGSGRTLSMVALPSSRLRRAFGAHQFFDTVRMADQEQRESLHRRLALHGPDQEPGQRVVSGDAVGSPQDADRDVDHRGQVIGVPRLAT